MGSEKEDEIHKLHVHLLYETIAIDYLSPSDNNNVDLNRFRCKCLSYLKSPIVKASKSSEDLLEEFERKGLISDGKYEVLKELVGFSAPLLQEVKDVERAIRVIKKMGSTRKSRKRKASESIRESPHIDDLLVRVDFCEVIPLESENYDSVIRKLNRISRKMSQIGFELIFHNPDLYMEFSKCHEDFNERKEESARILRLFYYFENENYAAEEGKKIIKFAKEGRKMIKDNPSDFNVFKEHWRLHNQRLKEHIAFNTWLSKKGAKVRKQLFGSIFLFLLFDCRANLATFMTEYNSGNLQEELQGIFITEDFLNCFRLLSAKIEIYVDQEEVDSYLSYLDDFNGEKDKDDSEKVAQLEKKIDAAELNLKDGRRKESLKQAREALEEMKTVTKRPPGNDIVRLIDIFRKVQSELFMIKTYYQGKLMEEEQSISWDGFALWREFYRNKQDPEVIYNATDEIFEEYLNRTHRIAKGDQPVIAFIFEDILRVHGLLQESHTEYYITHDVISSKMKLVVLYGNFLFEQGQFGSVCKLCIEESRQTKGNADLLFLWAKALFFLGDNEEAVTKITEAKKNYQGDESVLLPEIDGFMEDIKNELEEDHKDDVPHSVSIASKRDDSIDEHDNVREDMSAETQITLDETLQMEEAEVGLRKSASPSTDSESGLSLPCSDDALSSSEIHMESRRVPIEIQEDMAYTGKDSSSEADSGLGSSLGSSYTEFRPIHRGGKYLQTSRGPENIQFDQYLDGIKLSKHTVDNFKKTKTKYHFPYPKLEKDQRKLSNMCQNSRYKRCIVEVKGAHEAVCTVIDTPKEIQISISGRSRCGQVFTGDEVVVHILEGGDTIPRLKKELDSEIYGEIVGFCERHRHRNIDHPVFLCVFDNTDDQVSSVRPICKTIPKVFIRHKKETKRHEIELYEYSGTHQTLTFLGTKCIHSKVRHHLVLMVAYIHWEQEIYPKGVVLNIFERGYSIKQEFDLLAFQTGIKQTFSSNFRKTMTEIQSFIESQGTQESKSVIELFTIAKSDNEIPSHAFSFQTMDNGVKYLGIHIVDVSEIIPENSPLDDEARKRGCSFGSRNYQYPMFPAEVVNKFCNFNEEFVVPTISVFFQVDADDRVIQPKVCRDTQKLSYRLSFNEVQNVIDTGNGKCNRCDGEGECHLMQMLRVATNLRRSRLGHAELAYCLEMEIDDNHIDIDVEKHHDVRVIVEEFLHLTNFYIATSLQSKEKVFPILHQAPPKKEHITNWKKSFKPLWNFVISLQDYSLGDGSKISVQKEKLDKIRYTKIIGIQRSWWERIVECIESSDTKELKELMFTDELHPMLAIAKQQWVDFQSNVAYSTYTKQTKNESAYYSLHFPIYCSITSPLHFYSDIITQRILASTISKTELTSYTYQDMKRNATLANECMTRLSLFNNEAKKVKVSAQILRHPLFVSAFVFSLDKSKIKIIIPGFENVGDGNIFQINVCDLQPSGEAVTGKDVITGNDYLTIKWEKRLYSLNRRTGTVETNSHVHNINPHQKSHFLRLSVWRNLVLMLMKGDPNYSKSMRDFESLSTYAPESRKAVMDVSSEIKNGHIVNQRCTFTLKFVLGQIIPLQIQSDFVNGKLEILPQFIEITSNFKICLNHIREPVSCFEMCAENKIKSAYTSLKDYCDTWIPLVLMEAASAAIADDSIILNNVTIHFEGKGGFFYLDHGFCEIRDINMASIPLEFFQCHDPNDMYVTSRADYLCIRCSAQDFKTGEEEYTGDDMGFVVLHAKVIDITNEADKKRYKIDFHLHISSQVLDDKERKIVNSCGIEILPKGDVVRRTEVILKRLDLASTLPKIITMRKLQKIPKLDEDHRAVATSIGDDIIDERVTLGNTKQREAIHKALHSSFSLIQGPPGTGKTFTAVKLVYLFCKVNRCLLNIKGEKSILVFCGPSNKSVDVVAKATLETLKDVEHAPKICRLYGKVIEHSVYPIPGRSTKSKRHVERRADESLKDISIHNLIRREGVPHAEKLKELDDFFNSISEEDLHKDHNLFRKYIKNIKEYRSCVTAATMDEIQNFEAIFCTTAVATKGLLFQKKKVFQIIIDEAAMCTEPETIAAIVATGAKQVVLIGDHKQLRPVVNNLDAKVKGLEQSLFEHYAELVEDETFSGTVNFTRLTTQYRMHEKICEFPSMQFYYNELKTATSVSGPPPDVAQIWPVSSSPIVFCHVEGMEEKLTYSMEEGNHMSRKNIQEVEQVIRVYKHLIKLGVRPSQINVMSQYNAQCSLLKKKLSDENYADAHVSTVFQSQGGEWDYVIFSTVCSLPEYRIEPQPTIGWQKANLGFITDEHQINVALTRAKQGLVIIGNKNLLKCDDKVWKKLIKYYEREKCAVDAREFPKAKKKRRKASTRVDKNNGDWIDA